MVTGGGEDPDCWTNFYTNDNYQGECHPFYLVVDKDEGICAEIHCLSIYLTWKKSQEKNNFFFFILKVDKAKKKKKLCLRWPDLPYFFPPTLNFFFTFQKKIQNKRRKMAKIASKSVEWFKSYKQLQK